MTIPPLGMKSSIKYGIIKKSKSPNAQEGNLCAETPEGSFAFTGNEDYSAEEYLSNDPTEEATRRTITVEEFTERQNKLRKRLKQLPFLLKAEYWEFINVFEMEPLTKKEFIARLVMKRLRED